MTRKLGPGVYKQYYDKGVADERARLCDASELGAWHSIEEELPDGDEWVLVYGDGAMACRAYVAKKEQFEDWQGCTMPGLDMDHITHWMHLPVAPQE